MGVVFLSCVSPSGTELEESNKNPKKLDAMTLIKEGGSQHTLGLGPRADRTTFPSSTTTQEVAAAGEAASLAILTLIGLSQPLPLVPVTY